MAEARMAWEEVRTPPLCLRDINELGAGISALGGRSALTESGRMGLAIAQKSTTEQSPLQDQNQAHVEPGMGKAADQCRTDHHKARGDQEKCEARGIGKEECQRRARKSHEKKDRQGPRI